MQSIQYIFTIGGLTCGFNNGLNRRWENGHLICCQRGWDETLFVCNTWEQKFSYFKLMLNWFFVQELVVVFPVLVYHSYMCFSGVMTPHFERLKCTLICLEFEPSECAYDWKLETECYSSATTIGMKSYRRLENIVEADIISLVSRYIRLFRLKNSQMAWTTMLRAHQGISSTQTVEIDCSNGEKEHTKWHRKSVVRKHLKINQMSKGYTFPIIQSISHSRIKICSDW